MILSKGDEVKLKSGETAEIIEIWGVARTWCKLRTSDGQTIFAMADAIEFIIISSLKKKTKTRR